MRLLQIVPERWRGLVDEGLKFGAIGAINTAVDFAVFNVLLVVGPLKAKIIATVVSTTLSYLMNRYWTFAARERTSARREYVLFFALNLVGLVIQLAVIAPAKYGLHFSEHGPLRDRIALNIANALGIAVAMVFRFWSYRTFVFKERLDATVAAVEEAIAGAGTVDIPPAAQPMRADASAAAEASGDLTGEQFAQLTDPLEVEMGIEEFTGRPLLVPHERSDS